MTAISPNYSLREITDRLRPIPVSQGTIDTRPVIIAEPSAEEKARLAQMRANSDALAAEAKRRLQEVEDSNHLESKDILLPNISNLSKDMSEKVKGIVSVMIRGRDDVSMNVSGAYGDKKITSLQEYLSTLNEHIKNGTIGPSATQPAAPIGADLPDVATLSSTAATAVYKQVQSMIANHETEGRAFRAHNGEVTTSKVETYLSWLAQASGVDRAA